MLSPFQCVFGYQPLMFSTLEKEVGVPSAMALAHRCHWTWIKAHQCLLRTASQHRKMADRQRTKGSSFQVGQRVWLSTKNLSLSSGCRKLYPRSVGPFPFAKITNPVAVRLQLKLKHRIMQVHPTFHISDVKSYEEIPLVSASPPSPPPRIFDGEPVYTVKRLLAVHRRGRGQCNINTLSISC